MSNQQLMDPLGEAHSELAADAAGPPAEVLEEMARADVRHVELAWGGLHVAFQKGEPGSPTRVELETVDGEPLGELTLADAIAMACDDDPPAEA